MIWLWIVLGTLAVVAVGLFFYWALWITEGAYLGRRAVALMYNLTPGYYDRIKQITWKRDGEISVNMGLGSLTFRVPREVGVRLIKDTFLTGLDAEGLEKRDGHYYSDNWDSAEIQLVIEVEAAFGKIKVEWAG